MIGMLIGLYRVFKKIDGSIGTMFAFQVCDYRFDPTARSLKFLDGGSCVLLCAIQKILPLHVKEPFLHIEDRRRWQLLGSSPLLVSCP